MSASSGRDIDERNARERLSEAMQGFEWQRVEAALEHAQHALKQMDKGDQSSETGWDSDELLDAFIVLGKIAKRVRP